MQIINESTELVDVRSLSPHPRNPNIGDVGQIAESIRTNGFYGAIIAQRSTGHILVGHHRYAAAVEEGASEVPVTWVDVDDTHALKILLADNRTAEFGKRDEERLAELLSELQTLDSLAGTGYGDQDLDALIQTVGTPEVPEEFKGFDEDIQTEHRCPKCGYEWSGKSG